MTRGLKDIDINVKTSTQYEHLCGKLPKFIGYMHPFGKTGTLKDCLQNSPKSPELGVTCMFVDYAKTSSVDCAVMVDPTTNIFQRYKSRDVIFLKYHYYKRDPNILCNGCILMTEGLDPLLLERGSEAQNNADQTESQRKHFQNLDANSEDKDDVPAPRQTT